MRATIHKGRPYGPDHHLLDRTALWRQRARNRAAWTGHAIAGWDGIVLGLAVSGSTLLLGSTTGGALFRQAYGAVVLDRHNASDLVALVGELARRADLARAPTLHLVPSPVLQAMAAGGREDPAIAVTSGLLQALPPRELASVLAHEVAHIRHGDILVMRLAATARRSARCSGSGGGIGTADKMRSSTADWTSHRRHKENMMKSETAILIWLPPGDVPQEPSFSATAASTFLSLADALAVAAKSSDGPAQPWISTADAIYTPEQIRIMIQTSREDD